MSYSRCDYHAEVNEVLEFYGSAFDMLTDLVKYAEMFRESNEDFYLAAQNATVDENAITLAWKEGDETYERSDVDEWNASDFSNYLAMWDDDFSVMTEIMKIEYAKMVRRKVGAEPLYTSVALIVPVSQTASVA